jgi:hypothetical protein
MTISTPGCAPFARGYRNLTLFGITPEEGVYDKILNQLPSSNSLRVFEIRKIVEEGKFNSGI